MKSIIKPWATYWATHFEAACQGPAWWKANFNLRREKKTNNRKTCP